MRSTILTAQSADTSQTAPAGAAPVIDVKGLTETPSAGLPGAPP
ncbi:hypothetical protein [Streptomyces decoyicus]